MAFGHDPFLVVLSVLIAVQASYVSSIITVPLTTKRDLSPSVTSVVRQVLVVDRISLPRIEGVRRTAWSHAASWLSNWRPRRSRANSPFARR